MRYTCAPGGVKLWKCVQCYQQGFSLGLFSMQNTTYQWLYSDYWKQGHRKSSYSGTMSSSGSGNSEEHIRLLIFMLLFGSIHKGMWEVLNWGMEWREKSLGLELHILIISTLVTEIKTPTVRGKHRWRSTRTISILWYLSCRTNSISWPTSSPLQTEQGQPVSPNPALSLPSIPSHCFSSTLLNTVEAMLNHTEEFQIKELEREFIA